MLSGYKTYIVAAIMVIKSLAPLVTGEAASFLEGVNWDQLLLALGLGAVRAGVASSKF